MLCVEPQVLSGFNQGGVRLRSVPVRQVREVPAEKPESADRCLVRDNDLKRLGRNEIDTRTALTLNASGLQRRLRPDAPAATSSYNRPARAIGPPAAASAADAGAP